MKCLCRNAQTLLICANTLFVLMGLSIMSTGIYLSTIMDRFGDIPGAPTKSAINAMIGIGIALAVIACMGCMGAQYRKNEGTEKRGFLLLVAYAICMAVLLVIEIAIGVAIYTWIGGSLGPLASKVPSKHQSKLDSSIIQAENFINCTYNFCCLNGGPNVTLHEFKNASAICHVNAKGLPMAAPTGIRKPDKKCPDTGCDSKEEKLRKGCYLVSKALKSKEQCLDYSGFRSEVAATIIENVRPIALAACIVGGVQFLLLLSALFNIFWCCGKSDKVDDFNDDVYY